MVKKSEKMGFFFVGKNNILKFAIKYSVTSLMVIL